MFEAITLQKALTGLYRWDGNNPEEVTDEFFTWLQSVHYTQHGIRPHKSEAVVRCSLQKEPCQLKMQINLSSWLSQQLLPESWNTASCESIPAISGVESYGNLSAGLRAWPAPDWESQHQILQPTSAAEQVQWHIPFSWAIWRNAVDLS